VARDGQVVAYYCSSAKERMRSRTELAEVGRLVTVVVFACALTLGVVVVGCPPDSGSADEYTLTISSTAGGTVTTPGEGAFKYPAGTVVQLAASADEAYEFRGWTGDTGQIGDHNSASTTITMEGNYTVTAAFGEQGEGGGPFRH
jgi:uncharacterized repeat protein (TIGR02543 family)